MKRLEAILDPFLKRTRLAADIRFYSIMKAWRSEIAEPLSLHISPSSLREGMLLVNVDSPLWLQQVGFFKSDIKKKFAHLGVSDIRFRIGRVQRRQKNAEGDTERDKHTPDISDSDMKFIEKSVFPITDEELKDKVKHVLIKAFTSPLI